MIASHKGEIPVLVLLITFIAGIAGGLNMTGPSPSWLFGVTCGLLLLFIILGFGYQKFSIYKQRWLGGILLYPLLFLLGWLLAINHNELNDQKHFAAATSDYLTVTINSEPKIKGDLVRFTANVTQAINSKKVVNVTGTLLITIKDELAAKLFYGEQLLIPAKFAPVDPPFNPGEFNYKQYLADHNLHHQAFLFPKQYVILKSGQGNPVIAYALQTRQNLVKKLQANMRDTNAIAVASTLILGYKADLGNDILQAYSKTGTIHILSVSGGHVAIIFLLLNWALDFLNGYKRGRIVKTVIIITLIWAYSLLTGFSPAVCRAAVMISLIIAGKTYSRYINTLNILAVSAFALLLYDPFLISDVGFQLSYLAVAGLVIFQPIVYSWRKFNNRILDKIWLACSVSIAAQAITFPLSAYYFHQFPVYFLVSNLLIAVPVIVMLYAGVFLLLLPQLPFSSPLLGSILEKTTLLMNKTLAYIEHAPYASVSKIWLTPWEFLLLVLIIFLFFYFIYYKKAWLIKTALAGTLLLCLSVAAKHISADKTQSVTFLNLRKHSGIIFKNGRNGVVLTDLQDTDKYFQYAIQPALDSSRISYFKVYHLNGDVTNKWLFKRGGFIQFLNKRLIVLNPDEAGLSIPQQLQTDYLFTANNANVDKSLLSKTKLLIIDANNTDRQGKDLMAVAAKLKIRYHHLRRNKSITCISNRQQF